MSSSRGFSLIEVSIALVVAAILASLGIGQLWAQIPRYRTGNLANRFVLDVRKASALASRTNRPITLTMNPDGCSPGYTISSSAAEYERVCFGADYPGVVAATASAGSTVSCSAEAEVGYDALPSCSLCADKKTIRFLPNGEVETPSVNGDTLIFGPKGEVATMARAVGIRNVTGKTRAYRQSGSGWECL